MHLLSILQRTSEREAGVAPGDYSEAPTIIARKRHNSEGDKS